MIQIKEQNELFELLGKTLRKPLACFAVGGTAMMYLGYKSATKDIDLVFFSKEDQQEFKEALLGLGFSFTSPRHVYVKTEFPAMSLSRGKEFLLDLFVKRIVHFELSERMASRPAQQQEFTNLILKIPQPEDIITLKCATDREGDLYDAKTIIESQEIDWKIITEEIILQAKKQHYAPSRLHNFLSQLEEKYNVQIPKKVFIDLENWMKNH